MLTIPVYSQEDNGGAAGGSEKVGKADLTISGTLYADGLRLENVSLLLKEDGDVVDEVRSDANGKFKVKIKLDKIFTLHFVKDDFADKIVEIDTRNVPDNNRKYPFYYKGWRVDMYPLDLDVDYSILKKPVAVVVYNPTEDGLVRIRNTNVLYVRVSSSWQIRCMKPMSKKMSILKRLMMIIC